MRSIVRASAAYDSENVRIDVNLDSRENQAFK